MQNTIPLMMTLSGTVILLAYILLYIIAKRFFGARWRYNILKMSIFFFLFPLPYFKYKAGDLLSGIIPGDSINLEKLTARQDLADFIIRYQEEIHMPIDVKLRLIFMGVAIVVACIFLFIQLYQYFTLKKNLNVIRKEKREVTYLHSGQIEDLKKKLGISQKVTILISSYVDTPFVTGIIKPFIYLPEYYLEQMKEEELKLIITHELIHVKHGDLLIKFIAILGVVINWYNPISYLLFYEISNIGEIYCDEELLRGKEESLIKQYGSLLIDAAAGRRIPAKNKFMSQLVNSDTKALKRRIIEMKNRKREKIGIVALSAAIMICFMGTLTAFAYESPMKIGVSEESNFTYDPENGEQWGEFVIGGGEEEIPYDKYFMDKDGNMYEVKKNDQQNRAKCSHSYVPGEYTTHDRVGKGCKIMYYKAKRCTKCSNVVLGDYINTSRNDVCRH